MNDKRRSKIKTALKGVRSLMQELEGIKEEEDEYRENMPENMQDGEKYQTSEEASDALEYAIDSLGECETNLEESVTVV